MDIHKLLVDVIELSKNLCTSPIRGKLAYATPENFVGRVIDGYSSDVTDKCLLTPQVAAALCDVQNELIQRNLGLFIFDAYRPQRAVRDFAQWFTAPSASEYEKQRKLIHYPNIDKKDLAPLGYAPDSVSKHNFGNAVDLSLIDLNTNLLLDMGACFDFFDEISHQTATAKEIGERAYQNRSLLTTIMKKHHFIPYEKEFWHFDYYKKEIDTPLDIPIQL